MNFINVVSFLLSAFAVSVEAGKKGGKMSKIPKRVLKMKTTKGPKPSKRDLKVMKFSKSPLKVMKFSKSPKMLKVVTNA